jgi:hypothetical protein
MDTLTDSIARDLPRFGGILRCTTCSAELPLGDIAFKLARGWPKCCGYTMRWVTQRQLDEEASR